MGKQYIYLKNPRLYPLELLRVIKGRRERNDIFIGTLTNFTHLHGHYEGGIHPTYRIHRRDVKDIVDRGEHLKRCKEYRLSPYTMEDAIAKGRKRDTLIIIGVCTVIILLFAYIILSN